jgi:DNA ligase D-like protein (predicted 3'-phosphoesterase)
MASDPADPAPQPNPDPPARSSATPVPAVDPDPVREPGRPAFVLHEHRRPQHHFDLRLEEDGVLRSWAVPRGLPTSPGQNRLAVQVPDHDLEHLTYTDADKSIADIGWWEEEDRNERRLVFTLQGQGVPRRYALIRTSKDWLLHLTKDQPPS